MSADFDKQAIMKALKRLGQLALEKGIEVELNIYGGSAMLLAYQTSRRTRDVDAVFRPKEEVLVLAERVADELSLPPSWLSDDVRFFLAPDDREAKRELLLELEGIRVQVPTAAYLLAMKARAAREPLPGYDGDRGDLAFLIRKEEIRDLDQLQEVIDRFFPDEVIPRAKIDYLLGIIEEEWSGE